MKQPVDAFIRLIAVKINRVSCKEMHRESVLISIA